MKGFVNMETSELFDAILADLSRTLGQLDATQIEDLQDAILSADRVFIAGKGRSGLQMKAFAMRLMHLRLTVHVVDDVTTPALAEGDLLLVGSSSGTDGFAAATCGNRPADRSDNCDRHRQP